MAQTLINRSRQQETVTGAVVTAVADLTDSEPEDLEPLFATIDPDALEALFEPTRDGVTRSPERVTFTYSGCEVVVSGDGTVSASRAGRETSRQWT